MDPRHAMMTPYTVMVDYNGTWMISIFVLMSACTMALIFSQKKQIGFWACLFWSAVVVHGLYLVEYPAIHFQNYLMAFKTSAGQTLVESILAPFAMMKFGPFLWKYRRAWVSALCAYAGYCAFFSKPGLMLAVSFNSALAVLCLPFVPIWLMIPIIAIVITRHSGTAQLMLAAQACVLGFNYVKFTKFTKVTKYLITIGLAVAAILSVFLAFHFMVEGPWWEGNGRFALMLRSFSIWKQSLYAMWMGFGPGTFLYVSVIMDHFMAPIFYQMHSDFLQIAFEHGILGWTLAMMVVFQSVRRSLGHIDILAALAAAFVFCLTYHPMRFAPTQIVMAMIFYRALIEKEVDIQFTDRNNHVLKSFYGYLLKAACSKWKINRS